MGCSVRILKNMKYCVLILENLMFAGFSEINSTFLIVFDGILEALQNPTRLMFAAYVCEF